MQQINYWKYWIFWKNAIKRSYFVKSEALSADRPNIACLTEYASGVTSRRYDVTELPVCLQMAADWRSTGAIAKRWDIIWNGQNAIEKLICDIIISSSALFTIIINNTTNVSMRIVSILTGCKDSDKIVIYKVNNFRNICVSYR